MLLTRIGSARSPSASAISKSGREGKGRGEGGKRERWANDAFLEHCRGQNDGHFGVPDSQMGRELTALGWEGNQVVEII